MSEPITNRLQNYDSLLNHKPNRFVMMFAQLIDYIRYAPRQWITNIKRLIYWAPVIWNDRDHDYSFIYKIVDHKLASIEKSSESWKRLDQQAKTEKIAQIRQWIQKANCDEFDLIETEYKQYIEKYGDLVSWSTKIDGSSLFELHLANEKCTTQQLADEANQQYCQLIKLANERHNMYRNRVWKAFAKHIDQWWD